MSAIVMTIISMRVDFIGMGDVCMGNEIAVGIGVGMINSPCIINM